MARGILGNDDAVCGQEGFKFDPQRAKQLLKDAGYGDKSINVSLMTWTGGNREKAAEIFQNQLKNVGIQAQIQVTDIGTLNARVKQEQSIKTGNGAFDMMGWAWFDPDILYALWHSPGWVNGYHDPTLDKMLEEQRRIFDPAQRKQKVQAIFQYLFDHAVMVPLYTPGWNWILAVRSQVTGVRFGPFNRIRLNDAAIAK